jgi:hypothetical protein
MSHPASRPINVINVSGGGAPVVSLTVTGMHQDHPPRPSAGNLSTHWHSFYKCLPSYRPRHAGGSAQGDSGAWEQHSTYAGATPAATCTCFWSRIQRTSKHVPTQRHRRVEQIPSPSLLTAAGHNAICVSSFASSSPPSSSAAADATVESIVLRFF